jgi:translation initiation factor IF-2
MWDCPECGTLRIAASLTACPVCRKERDMAKATTGGASNARALPGETGYVEREQAEPAVPAADAAQDAPAEAAPDVPASAPPEPVQAVSAPPKPEPKAAPKAAPASGGGGSADPAVKVTAS